MGMTGNYVAVDEKILQQIKSNPTDLLDIHPDEYPNLDIDKAWQAIHFLLCHAIADGEPPLGYVVPMREENVIDIEVGDFLGLFALSPEQVSETYEAIKNIGEEELRAKYQFDSLVENEIYPVVDGDSADDFFEYLYENFKSIQALYKSSSENRKSIVFYIM